MLCICRHCGKEFNGRKERIYCSRVCRNKGREVTLKTRKKFSIFHSSRKRKPFTLDTKIKMSLAKTGEKEFNGFKSSEQHILRNSKEYIEWRLMVFVRDSFTCQICEHVGGYLEAHHIKSFIDYPELRFNVNNGITLCKKCHRKEHKNKRWFN